jgi:hypothetical protein
MGEYTQQLEYTSLPNGGLAVTLLLTFPNGAKRAFTERLTGADARAAMAEWSEAEGAHEVAAAYRMVGAAKAKPRTGEWWWDSFEAKRQGKRPGDYKAMRHWWDHVLNRDSRSSVRSMLAEGPAGASPVQLEAWWRGLSKNSRQAKRRRHGGDGGVLRDLGSAASSVVDTTIDAVTLQPIAKHIPLVRDVHSAIVNLQRLPLTAVSDVLSGKRLDRVALGQFKSALGSAKTLAPYAQTVVALVPGVGQGLAGGIGAGLALAEGKTITEALIAAARGAVPGGALAQAAFDVAVGIAQGKPLEQVAINALPIDASAKRALVEGAKAARDLARGKRVDQVILDGALRALPAAAGKAAQVGVALGAAQSLQRAGVSAAKQLAAGKVFAAAAKQLDAVAQTPHGAGAALALKAAAQLSAASAAASLGAPKAARKLAGAARGKLSGLSESTARDVYALASRTSRNVAKLAEGKKTGSTGGKPAAVVPASVLAAARAGRIKSNRKGVVSQAELTNALRTGRVFFVRASA